MATDDPHGMDLAEWSDIVDAARTLMWKVQAAQRDLPLARPPSIAEIREFMDGDDLQAIQIALPDGRELQMVLVESLVSTQNLWREVGQPLLRGTAQPENLPRAKPIETWDELLHRLLEGWVMLIPPGGQTIGLHLDGLKQRAVGQPTTERQVIGPKEGMVERFDTNIGLIRNRLRDPALRVEVTNVGRRSRTPVAMLYLGDVARPQLVDRTRQGLASISVDFIRTEMDVAELTFQHGWTVFPLVEQTERPDRVAFLLSQGRVALVVEGQPFAVVVPTTFWDFQHDGEGSLPGPATTMFIRLLRYVGVFIAVALPGLYVALLTSGVSVLPSQLAQTLSGARLAIPYPVATESVIMLVLVDVLSEATTQSASAIGNALAIVGTLIVGQLIVQAHLASNLMMIVVATSIIGSFMTLKFSLSYAPRIWKYPIVVLATVGGLLGWFTGLVLLLVHLSSLESAGVPYLSPVAGNAPAADAWRVLLQPNRSRLRRRPQMLRPIQNVSARRGGRR